jgi:hypothetical protein
MVAPGSSAVFSIAVLVVALAVDVWIYRDAGKRRQDGNPVSVAIGSLRIETPEAWFLGSVILWVVFVPLYLTATGRNPFARGRRPN